MASQPAASLRNFSVISTDIPVSMQAERTGVQGDKAKSYFYLKALH